MIRANCRDRFTSDDFIFISNILSKMDSEKAAIVTLLSDSESRDEMLDTKTLFTALTENQHFSKISPFLYFYVLLRRIFLENDLNDRELTDYVASMLAEFFSADRVNTISNHHEVRYHYFVDMMQDGIDANSFETFLLRSHMGNYALFMTGIFPERIFYKSTYGHKAPGFEYFEMMGKNGYRMASQHELAVKLSLMHILNKLSDHFGPIRLALNNMVDNYITVDNRPPTLDKILRQIYFGKAKPGWSPH